MLSNFKICSARWLPFYFTNIKFVIAKLSVCYNDLLQFGSWPKEKNEKYETYERKKERERAGASWTVCVIVLIFSWDFIVRAWAHRNRTKFRRRVLVICYADSKLTNQKTRNVWIYNEKSMRKKDTSRRARASACNGLRGNNKKKKHWGLSRFFNKKNWENCEETKDNATFI